MTELDLEQQVPVEALLATQLRDQIGAITAQVRARLAGLLP